jgi:hypothetical protein
MLHEQRPRQLLECLADFGHVCTHPGDQQLTGYCDPEISRATQRESRVPVAQDVDFSEARRFAPAPGILLVSQVGADAKKFDGSH